MKKLLLIISLVFLGVSANAKPLKDLPGDGGAMMNMALLTVNTTIDATKQKIIKNVREKYRLEYQDSSVVYDNSKDKIIVTGAFEDQNSPPVFNKEQCGKLLSEVRMNVQKSLADKKSTDSFIKSYSMMVKNKNCPKPEVLVSEVKKNIILQANVGLVSETRTAICSGMVNGDSISFSIQ